MNDETTISDAPETEAAEHQPAETDWKAQARKWEARAKANRDTVRQLEAKLQEHERQRQRETDVSEVAKETGIPASLLEVCTTREQMEQLATEWANEAAARIPSAPRAPETRIIREGAQASNRDKFADFMGTALWAH